MQDDEMVQIRFIRQGANSLIGGFSSGDQARVSDAFARHLVEEARVAEYAQSQMKGEAPKRGRKPKGAANGAA